MKKGGALQTEKSVSTAVIQWNTQAGTRACLCLGVLVLWTVLEMLQLCSQNSEYRARQSTTGKESVIRPPSFLVFLEGVNGRTENQTNQTGKQTRLAAIHCLPIPTQTSESGGPQDLSLQTQSLGASRETQGIRGHGGSEAFPSPSSQWAVVNSVMFNREPAC